MLVKIRPTYSDFCQKGITEFIPPRKMFISRGFKFNFCVFFKFSQIFTLYMLRNIVPEVTCMRKKGLFEVMEVEEKDDGEWISVEGMDDAVNYNAKEMDKLIEELRDLGTKVNAVSAPGYI